MKDPWVKTEKLWPTVQCCTAWFCCNEQVKNWQIGCCRSMCLHDIRKNRFIVLFCEKLTFKTHNVSFRLKCHHIKLFKDPVLYLFPSVFFIPKLGRKLIINSKPSEKKMQPSVCTILFVFVPVEKKKTVSRGRASTLCAHISHIIHQRQKWGTKWEALDWLS